MSGSLAAFACGVILLYTFPVLPPLPWLATVGCLLPGVLLCSGVRHRGVLAMVLLGFFAGLGWAAWHASDRLQHVLPVAMEGETLRVSGYLCSIPSQGSFNSLRFNVCVTHWHDTDATGGLPTRLRLAWYGDGEKVLPGHRLTLTVVLKRPHGAVNPQGFRYETWLFRKGFGATGTVRAVAADHTLPCGVHCHYLSWRQGLADSVSEVLGEAEHYPLLASLLIGDRGEMTSHRWDVLKATGTIHLVAISGLHLGLVAIGVGFVVARLVNLLPPGRPRPSARRVLVLVTVAVGCVTYALAAGFTVPTRRALIMAVVAGWVLLRGHQVSPWHALATALFLVLLTDPFAPLDQGFWLSFGAVAVLILVFSGRLKGPGWWRGLLLAQFAVFAGLWPIVAVLGQEQPYAGFIANLFAIPWVSLVVMPVLMVGSGILWVVPGSEPWVLVVFDGVLDVLWSALSSLATLDLPSQNPGVGRALLLSLLLLAAVMLPSVRVRCGAGLAAALLLIIPLLGEKSSNPWVSVPDVVVWDVGQGMSVLVRHQDQVLLYDTGPAIPGVFSAVESVLVPNLRALGIRSIDTLVISHGDGDHAGGLDTLFATFPVGRVISGEPGRLGDVRTGHAGPGIVHCDTAHGFSMGAIDIDFWQSPAPDSSNDASCVMAVTRSDFAAQVIIPGDITTTAEARLLANAAEWLPPAAERVVLAPHHGSNTSSSPAWVNQLAPRWVVYSAGYRHRFGHPHPAVTERYRVAGSHALNTAYSGAIRLILGRQEVAVDQQRASAAFWIRPPETRW